MVKNNLHVDGSSGVRRIDSGFNMQNIMTSTVRESEEAEELGELYRWTLILSAAFLGRAGRLVTQRNTIPSGLRRSMMDWNFFGEAAPSIFKPGVDVSWPSKPSERCRDHRVLLSVRGIWALGGVLVSGYSRVSEDMSFPEADCDVKVKLGG